MKTLSSSAILFQRFQVSMIYGILSPYSNIDTNKILPIWTNDDCKFAIAILMILCNNAESCNDRGLVDSVAAQLTALSSIRQRCPHNKEVQMVVF
jgi:hypothetical protein